MPSTTLNYGLHTYDRTADSGESFLDYRDDISGTGATSNMAKIDSQMKVNADSISNISGAGRTTETIKENSDNIALNVTNIINTNTLIADTLTPSTKFYTASGTDSYSLTTDGSFSIGNGKIVNSYFTNKNTGISTLNVDGSGIRSIKVRNFDESLRDAIADELYGEISLYYDGTQYIVLDSKTLEIERKMAPFSGHNHFLNPNFTIWQRGEAFTSISNDFTADRWEFIGLAVNASRSSDTPNGSGGSLLFGNTVSSGTSFLRQRIEDVRTLKGNTNYTFSLWVKGTGSSFLSGANFKSSYGTGGSAEDNVNLGNIPLTASWAQFYVTFTTPDYGTKTITDDSFAEVSFGNVDTTSGVYVTGFRLEEGTRPSAITYKPKQEVLSACQRYFYNPLYNTTALSPLGMAYQNLVDTDFISEISFPVEMASVPTVTIGAATDFSLGYPSSFSCTTLVENVTTTKKSLLSGTTSARTSGQIYQLYELNTGSGDLVFSADI